MTGKGELHRREENMERQKHEGTKTWGDKNMRGQKHEIKTWGDKNMRGQKYEETKTWGDKNMRGQKHETKTWGDKNMRGQKYEETKTWGDKNMRGQNYEETKTWMNEWSWYFLILFLNEWMNEWTDTSLRYRHWRMCFERLLQAFARWQPGNLFDIAAQPILEYHWIDSIHNCPCEHSSKLQLSIRFTPSRCLDVRQDWYPMHYPEGTKARVSPVQSIEPHRILAPTRDSNQEPPGPESRVVTTILPLHKNIDRNMGQKHETETWGDKNMRRRKHEGTKTWRDTKI